jgi:hypothetical protein
VDSSIQSGRGAIKVFPKGGDSDPYHTTAPRTTGESVTVSGITVEVLNSDSSAGDTVRITADKLWVDKE